MKTNKIIIISCFILLLAFSAQALTYTPQTTGTLQTLEFVRAFDNGKAIAINSSVPSYYLYNGSDWAQISAPTAGQIGNKVTNRLLMDRLGNSLYVAYQNTTATVVMKYDAVTEAWTQYRNLTVVNSTGTNSLVCVKQDNKCYFGLESLELVYEVTPSYTLTINFSTQSVTTYTKMMRSNRFLMFVTSPAQALEWNGVAIQGRGTVAGAGSTFAMAHQYIDSNHRAICETGSGSGSGLYQTNTSSPNSFQNDPQTEGCFDLIAIDDDYYWINSGAGVFPASTIYVNHKNNMTNVASLQANKSLWSIDYNTLSQVGFVVGINGTVYTFGNGATTTHSITTVINPNPSVYGESVVIGGIPSNSGGYSADISIDIFNSTGSNVYGGACTVGDGQLCSTTVSGGTWTNFKQNQNYTVRISAVWTNGESEIQNTAWIINQNATITVKNYTMTGSQTTLDAFSNVNGVSNLTNNRIFSAGNNNSQINLISVDATNPNNLLTKSKAFTLSSSPNYVTSLRAVTDRIFLGTDDELYIFNNASFGDASQATQLGTSYGFSLSIDYIYDTTALSDTLAWVCRNGVSDDARRFNYSSLSFDATINENPCYTIRMDGDRLYIHKGTSGIKVYNSTNNALIASIGSISTQSGLTTHDRLSIYGNYLYAITGQTQISKYDISNPSSPTKLLDCYTNSEVISIEGVSDNEAIIGVDGQIRVCDFSNSEKYDTGSGKYLSTALKTYADDEIPNEIKRMDGSGKIAIAENNRIGIYVYSSSDQVTTTNNAPTITNITTPVTSICINQILPVTIEATDSETPDALTYDYDCNGVQVSKINSFTTPSFDCSYTTTGTKTIKAWVSDGTAIVLGAKAITVSNCTATTLNFKVLNGLTAEPVSDVLVNIQGETSTTTNSAGQSTTSNLSIGSYDVTFTKNGYVTLTDTYATNAGVYTIYLEPTTNADGESRNTLIVNVNDQQGTTISEALVSVTDPITGLATLASTNSFGQATFFDMSSGIELLVSAGKSGYDSAFTRTVVSNSQTKTITITIVTTGYENLSSGRGCQDYVRGLVFCSPLRTDGTGDTCTTNSDCLGDKCIAGKCNKFNWTYCDARGMDRDERCFASATLKAGGSGLSKGISANFLYVLAFIVVVMFMIMWNRSKRK